MSNVKSGLQNKLESLRAIYLKKLPEKLEEVERARQSLFLLHGDAREFGNLHRLVHTLVGTSSTFGLKDLSETARKLQEVLKPMVDGDGPFEPCALEREIDVYMSELKCCCSSVCGKRLAPLRVEVYASQEAVLPASRETKLIYIIDDDRYQLENLTLQIGHFGYAVKTFERLDDLKRAVAETEPAVVIMDIMFPEGGLAGVKAMADVQLGREKNLPVIFISCRGDLDARLQAVRSGADAYFVKPAHILDVIEKLDILTTHRIPDPYRILIIDDEPELAAYHSSVLQEAGMLTSICSNPLKIMEPLADFNPDLILMDMYMPGCSGHELALATRQMQAYFSIPIVFLSTETDPDKQLMAMRMGGDDFLTKPIQPAHLISSVSIRAERMRAMRSLMERDGLTGLFNHTKIREHLSLAVARAARQDGMLSLVMIDIDHFKQVNDTYGHATGDRVLMGLSRLLQQRIRKTDIVGRYGGEEFAVILLDTDLEAAKKVADEIRTSFSRIDHQTENRSFSVTLSCGLAFYPGCPDVERLSEAADKALYTAKRAGRNCTRVWKRYDAR